MKKSKGFKHVILTRYNNGIYDGKDAVLWMKERYQLFRSTRDSVLSQDADFEWVLSFDERTPDSYVTKCLTDPRMKATTRDVRDYFEGQEIDEPWVITTRIDNDDLYRPGALKAIQRAFEQRIMTIDIDYYQWDLNGNKTYTSGNVSKGETYRPDDFGSPFISLIEPSDRIKTVYCRPHSKLIHGYLISDDEKIEIPHVKIHEQLAFQVIHGKNLANKITGKEIQ